MEKADFLLEINVEELPVMYIRPALDGLKKILQQELQSSRLTYKDVYAAGTAKALICFIKDLSLKQEESSKEMLGPPKSAAFDKENNPTKQLLGFLNNQAASVKDVKLKQTPRGEYIFIEKKIEATQAREILLEIIPRVINSLHFPKTMRWDDSGLRFARPIESVLALLGSDNIKISIGNIPQEKVGKISAARYLNLLKKKALIDIEERKNKIKGLIIGEFKKISADLKVDEDLLEEVSFMVICPAVFTGGYDKKFLDIPEVILKASMAKYQRIFPVVKNNRLTNRFIAVLDGKGRDIGRVRKNYEKILEARLKDSLFFLKEDTKKHFSENVPDLKHLIFQNNLGNMFEKINRLQGLCSFACDALKIDGSLKKDILRAAELSKADLVTHMVGEFPSLQGEVGREYALKSGEKENVADAIREHYLPRGANDDLPESLEGAILAISDRMDNMVGFLGSGIDISSSFDPLGIRRNAQGLIQIAKEKPLRIRLDELIEKSIRLYDNRLKISLDELKGKIIGYIKERIEFLSGEIKPLGLKEAVLSVESFDVVDIFKRLNTLASISNKKYFLEAAKVVERTSNILKGAKKEEIGEVKDSLFKEDLEREAWSSYLKNKDKVLDFISKEDYGSATRCYADAFFKVLHDFFDKVMVNVEDSSLRINRLSMMKAINELYTKRVADLAKLPQIVVK